MRANRGHGPLLQADGRSSLGRDVIGLTVIAGNNWASPPLLQKLNRALPTAASPSATAAT